MESTGRLDKPVGKYTAGNRDYIYVYRTACQLLDLPKAQRDAMVATLTPEMLDRCRAEAKRIIRLRACPPPHT